MTMNKPEFEAYDFAIRRIAPEDGGGFSITFPDLPGCISDGDTVDEALANGRDAFAAWVQTCLAQGRQVPAPGSAASAPPVRFVQRLPQYLHLELVQQSAAQGVSLNSLVTVFVTEGLAKLRHPRPQIDIVAGNFGTHTVSAPRYQGFELKVLNPTYGSEASITETPSIIYFHKAKTAGHKRRPKLNA
jgi:antitoxin HicB